VFFKRVGCSPLLLGISASSLFAQTPPSAADLHTSAAGYYENHGVNVMVFDDYYPEGHQGGVTIVEGGRRVATNGDVRLEPAPGQWAPVPVVGKRTIDSARGTIRVELAYPDSSKNRRGFNPIDYPDLSFKYSITTYGVGPAIRVVVDLEKPLPSEWIGKVGFNLELFPGTYFGEYYFMDGKSGPFPRQANGPMVKDTTGEVEIAAMVSGRRLVVAPGKPGKEMSIVSTTGVLQLLDERGLTNNGWFAIRSTIAAGATKGAVEWVITPRPDTSWIYAPVIQVSQVGYLPHQPKYAVIELDKSTSQFEPIQLIRVREGAEEVVKRVQNPIPWGNFLRYKYLRFDFTEVADEGLYKISYGTDTSHEFEIRHDIFARNVWQPTLEYFLPVQMCHMSVHDRFRMWHGLCHMDDATMAPVNHDHFDGYFQGGETLTKFHSGEHVPGVNIGGWHDAGDYDLRVESQCETVCRLAEAYEFFKDDYDATSINEETHTTEMHVPDGIPDILQQIEHGVLSVVGGYESMGRLYRGIICPTLRQYNWLGDASTMSDGLVYGPHEVDPILHKPLPNDDRLLFTEENPKRELNSAQALAATVRVLRIYRPALADRCLHVAEALFASTQGGRILDRLNAAAELYLTTGKAEYKEYVTEHEDLLCSSVFMCSDVLGRVVAKLGDPKLKQKAEQAVRQAFVQVKAVEKEDPYGVPYRPEIWGAGWDVQDFGVKLMLLHLSFPDAFPADYAFNALNFVLGCHPGENTASFASGVGAKSLTVAYGANRDDWSYIPGGVGSGTALIRPDLPELKTWPYFWQQTEYVMGGGSMDFLFLALAADHLANK
jgi:endoglucanase